MKNLYKKYMRLLQEAGVSPKYALYRFKRVFLELLFECVCCLDA